MRGTAILSAWILLATPAAADLLRVPGE